MRVLTTSMCFPTPRHPDQGVFIRRRAEALAGLRGVSVQVVSPQLWCPGLRRCEHIEPQRGSLPVAFPHMLSVPPINWGLDGLAFARAIEGFVREQRKWHEQTYDLIDAHFVYPDGVGAWLAGRKLGIPVCVTVRGKIVSLSRKAVRRMQIAAMLRGVDARIAVSQSLVEWVHRVGGSDLTVDVIPNGVQASTFHWVDRDRARSMVNWSPETRYVLSVGHMQRVKGFDRLVDIWPAVRMAAGDVRLVLAGSERGERNFKRRLLRQIDACNARFSVDGQAPCVSFLGPQSAEDLNLLYNAADISTIASRSEGWNNAISESLATGTPVVATNVGGNAEQLCSSELGIIVPDGDLDGLAGAIVHALGRSWNRPLIAAHGCARPWSTVAREVFQVFRRTIATRRSTRPVTHGELVLHRAEAAS